MCLAAVALRLASVSAFQAGRPPCVAAAASWRARRVVGRAAACSGGDAAAANQDDDGAAAARDDVDVPVFDSAQVDYFRATLQLQADEGRVFVNDKLFVGELISRGATWAVQGSYAREESVFTTLAEDVDRLRQRAAARD